MQRLQTGIPNAAASLTGDAVAQPGSSPSMATAQRARAGKEEPDDAGADEQAETSEDPAADDTTGSSKGPAAGRKGTSLSAVPGQRRGDAGFSSGSAGGSEGFAGMVGRRVTRMQLLDSLPLPPVSRLFGLLFSWILVSLVNVFDAFAESNHPE